MERLIRCFVSVVLVGCFLASDVRGADIIWGSQISDMDVTNGIMPDQEFVDLLASAGHNVTRFEIEGGQAPLSSDHVNMLNMADLVILGRNNASGNFQDLDADPWNLDVTAPVLLMSAYLSRQNRLGWQAGNDVPDSGPTPLVAVDPNHPVFDGIALAGDGVTMAEDYNIMIDRGSTTIGTPLVAGANVIATNPTIAGGDGIAIAEWPTGTNVTPDNATAGSLAGPRYFFAGGSREAANVHDTAGMMDLTGVGQQLFLNTVGYILGVEPPVPGDFNGDGEVTAADFTILSDNLGGHLDGPVGRSEGDMNFDGRIDLTDFGQFKEAFPGAFAAATGVPEPSTIGLVACVLALIAVSPLRKRLRRTIVE
jgi:hypothetical protein